MEDHEEENEGGPKRRITPKQEMRRSPKEVMKKMELEKKGREEDKEVGWSAEVVA